MIRKGRGDGKIVRARSTGGQFIRHRGGMTPVKLSSRHYRADAHKNSQTVTGNASSVQAYPDRDELRWGSRHGGPTLNQESTCD